eukprot:TRINITY_DN421_c0_g1_i3.p1 TRINITY_DN421_c0_g1~~TRINITY_DN421_c0_g1_i3.p1  ORF type:complete len:1046 (-),score=276.90 TRINITY_DN421_c0_g1_i3:166-3303(-)
MDEVTNFSHNKNGRKPFPKFTSTPACAQRTAVPVETPCNSDLNVYNDVFGGPPKYTVPSFASQRGNTTSEDVFKSRSSSYIKTPVISPNYAAEEGLKPFRNSFDSYNSVSASRNAPPLKFLDVGSFLHQTDPNYSFRCSNLNSGIHDTRRSTQADRVTHRMGFSPISAAKWESSQTLSDGFLPHPKEQLDIPSQTAFDITNDTISNHRTLSGKSNSGNGFYEARDSTQSPTWSSSPKSQCMNSFSTSHSAELQTKSIVENLSKRVSLKDHVRNHIGFFTAGTKTMNGRSEGHSRSFFTRKHRQSQHENFNDAEYRNSVLSSDTQNGLDLADDIFVTINELKLLTKPTAYPPPSRPPPPIGKKGSLPNASAEQLVEGIKNSAFGRQGDHDVTVDNSSGVQGIPDDLSSTEAVSLSTMAMMHAMKKAEDRSNLTKKVRASMKEVSGGHNGGTPEPVHHEIKDIKTPAVCKDKEVKNREKKAGSDNCNKGIEKATKSSKEVHDSEGNQDTLKKTPISEDCDKIDEKIENLRKEKISEFMKETKGRCERERVVNDPRTAEQMLDEQKQEKDDRDSAASGSVEALEKVSLGARDGIIAGSAEPTTSVSLEHATTERAATKRGSTEAREGIVAEALERTARIARNWAAKAAEFKQKTTKVTHRQFAADHREQAFREAKEQTDVKRVAAVDRMVTEASERAPVEGVTVELRERTVSEGEDRMQAGRGFSLRHRAEERSSVERSVHARMKAEEVALARAQAEAHKRDADRLAVENAVAEARERARRAAASIAAAKENEQKVYVDRLAVENAVAEARGRARRAAASIAAAKENEQKFNDDLDAFFGTSFNPRRQKPITPRPAGKIQSQHNKTSNGFNMPSTGTSQSRTPANLGTDTNIDTASVSTSQEGMGEAEEKRRARLERHQRTLERQAKALAEKNDRDLQLQREQAERDRLADSLDADIRQWTAGKEGNIRVLLSTLQYILWPGSGWQPVSLTDIISSASVKKTYRKATLCVHPDKVQQKGATIQQKYIAEKVFDLLKEAWNKFNAEELC